jgi:hypothetical protein
MHLPLTTGAGSVKGGTIETAVAQVNFKAFLEGRLFDALGG